jgi:hypothetical protein
MRAHRVKYISSPENNKKDRQETEQAQNFELKGALYSVKVEKRGFAINHNFYGLFNRLNFLLELTFAQIFVDCFGCFSSFS